MPVQVQESMLSSTHPVAIIGNQRKEIAFLKRALCARRELMTLYKRRIDVLEQEKESSMLHTRRIDFLEKEVESWKNAFAASKDAASEKP